MAYYGRLPYLWPAHRAIRMIESLPDLWDITPTEPHRYRSAIAAAQDRARVANERAATVTPASGQELTALGIEYGRSSDAR
jgi:hypothetical protein